MEIDYLKLYFGEPEKINDYITIYQPTIGDMVENGELEVYSSISPFTSNPTTYRLQLWDNGKDWNKVSDWELFLSLYSSMNAENVKLFFHGFDFSKLIPLKDQEGNISLYICDLEKKQLGDQVLTEDNYKYMCKYIQTMLNQKPKVEKAKGKATKEAIIEEDRMNLNYRKNHPKENTSLLYPLVSSLLNHPGFKYNKNQLKEVGIVEFMDSVQRLQVYESTRALMSGVYSGMLDTKKLDTKTELNWLRDLNA